MRGRISKFTDEINEAAKEYIDNYADHGHPLPSVVGMAVVLNIAKSTLYKWAEEGRGEIPDTLAKCKDNQELELIHKGLTNDFNATIVKLALANHGYSDKVDGTLSAPGGGPVQTDSVFEFIPVSNDK